MSDDKYSVDCKAKKCAVYEGDNAGLDIKEGECEVRRDLMIKKAECVRIWGQIKDCRGCPVKGALVKLVKQVWKGHKYWYVGIAHTLTDCQGFYQFDICRKEEKCSYRVIAGKAAVDDRYYDEPAEAPKQRKSNLKEEAGLADAVDENASGLEEEEAAGEFEESEFEDTAEGEDALAGKEDAPEAEEEPATSEEIEQAPKEDDDEEASDDEYPYRSKEKDDAFDPDEDFLDDAYDRDGCDPCRYYMKD